MNIGFEGIEGNRDAWIEYRSTRYGSSDVGTICGFNPYMTALELWAVKTGKTERKEAGDAARFGQLVEPALIQFFAEKHQEKFEVADCQTTYEWEHDADFIASPDAWLTPVAGYEVCDEETGELCAGKGILECKHTAAHFDAWLDGGVPDWYLVQHQWQMGICNIEWGYFGALVGGRASDFKTPFFRFDADFFERLVSQVETFRGCVQSDIPPKAVGSDKKLLDELIERNGPATELPIDVLPALEKYEEARSIRLDIQKELKHWQGIEDDCIAEIKQQMGNSTTAVAPGNGVVVLKQVNRKGYEVKPSSYWTFAYKKK